MKTLVIGLGNPILGDDGVGWVVASEVARRLGLSEGGDTGRSNGKVEVDFASLGGLSLMERLTNMQRVILVDSIFTGEKPIGTVSCFTLEHLPDLNAGHSASAHDTSLRNALNVGRSMKIDLPADENVLVVAVEAQNVYDFTQELSPAVAGAVPEAVKTVLGLLEKPEK